MQRINEPLKLSLFQAYGIEIEYMIVDRKTLEICPFTDKLFHKISGEIANEIPRGDIALNNELALHVLELKTNGPKQNLEDIAKAFYKEITFINQSLEQEDKVLMPSAMHPWTKVDDIQLWPHDDQTIYDTYHSIFNCHGHGWSNLQSTHLNLPFANEEEFVKLHQAIRLVLPIIPALAASSPFCEGALSGYQSTRMFYYENNQKKVPLITGFVIPESISSQDEYLDKILTPMFEAIAPFDQDKTLQFEWLNSRGAIARFERNAIEIRVIDSQECPLADLCVVSAIIALIKRIIRGPSHYLDNPMHEQSLKAILDSCVSKGMQGVINSKEYLEQLNLHTFPIETAQELWSLIIQQEIAHIPEAFHRPLQTILEKGNLSERLASNLPENFSAQALKNLYAQLIDCLQENKLYLC